MALHRLSHAGAVCVAAVAAGANPRFLVLIIATIIATVGVLAATRPAAAVGLSRVFSIVCSAATGVGRCTSSPPLDDTGSGLEYRIPTRQRGGAIEACRQGHGRARHISESRAVFIFQRERPGGAAAGRATHHGA